MQDCFYITVNVKLRYIDVFWLANVLNTNDRTFQEKHLDAYNFVIRNMNVFVDFWKSDLTPKISKGNILWVREFESRFNFLLS